MNCKSENQALESQTINQKNCICKYLTKKYDCYIDITTLQVTVVCHMGNIQFKTTEITRLKIKITLKRFYRKVP